jgi:hypothetical protein
VVDVLLRAGACVYTGGPGYTTPFQMACQRGYGEIVEVLLRAGAMKREVEMGWWSCLPYI